MVPFSPKQLYSDIDCWNYFYRLAMILMTPVKELQPPISDMSASTLPRYRCTQTDPYSRISHHVLLRKVFMNLVHSNMYVSLFSECTRLSNSINVWLQVCFVTKNVSVHKISTEIHQSNFSHSIQNFQIGQSQEFYSSKKKVTTIWALPDDHWIKSLTLIQLFWPSMCL